MVVVKSPPPTGLPSRAWGFIWNLGAIFRAAAPKPWPTGSSARTTHPVNRPSAVTLHSMVAMPVDDAPEGQYCEKSSGPGLCSQSGLVINGICDLDAVVGAAAGAAGSCAAADPAMAKAAMTIQALISIASPTEHHLG